jgi:hypothetical protein
MRHEKKQPIVTHTEEKMQSIETVSECLQMLGLSDKDSKAAIINISTNKRKYVLGMLNKKTESIF